MAPTGKNITFYGYILAMGLDRKSLTYLNKKISWFASPFDQTALTLEEIGCSAYKVASTK